MHVVISKLHGGELGLRALDEYDYSDERFLGPPIGTDYVRSPDASQCNCLWGTAVVDANGNCSCINDVDGTIFLGPPQEAPGEITTTGGGVCNCLHGTPFIDASGNCACVADPPLGTGGIKGPGAITTGIIRHPGTIRPGIKPMPMTIKPATTKPDDDSFLDGELLGIPMKNLLIGGAAIAGLFALIQFAPAPPAATMPKQPKVIKI